VAIAVGAVVTTVAETVIDNKMVGTVKWYDSTKGFGFIESEENKDFFVHRTGILDNFLILEPNQKVEFEIKESDRGPVAFNVKAI
jgi:CspA family cold shock protein